MELGKGSRRCRPKFAFVQSQVYVRPEKKVKPMSPT